MTSVPGVDHPEEQSDADVTLASRGGSVNARVESVGDVEIVVRPSAGEYVGQSVVVPGDQVEVHWKASETRRVLPAGVLEVESGAVVRWRLQILGPAEDSQRRTAVRGRVVPPVSVGHGPVELNGQSWI